MSTSDHDLLTRIDVKVTRIERHLEKMNGRVSANERWRYMITGALVLLGAAVGWLKFG